MKRVGHAHAIGSIGGVLKGLGIVMVILILEYIWRHM